MKRDGIVQRAMQPTGDLQALLEVEVYIDLFTQHAPIADRYLNLIP